MSEWMKTVEDALSEARDVDDPCCMQCTRAALTLLVDEVERLRAMEARVIRIRDDTRPVGERRPGPFYRVALEILGGAAT